MGKSCSGKSCMVLARLARIKNARRRKSKEAILRVQIRLEISAPINQMRPHKIFRRVLRPQGRWAVADSQGKARGRDVIMRRGGRSTARGTRFCPPALAGV